MKMKIQTAELEWQTVDGIDVPISKTFGDVYFSKENGLLETRHVFLNGNDLAERLAQLDDFQYFCVGETGFGTGLNILALWQLWQQVRPDNHSHLHVISVEKYPLSLDDLRRALAVWTELADLSEQLLDVYPLPIAGCHRLNFAKERFSIDLWLGDAVDIFPIIHTQHPVNAWFLDGFAPSCNPDFWQDHILKHIIRLSSVGTTFASFTVAGVVKRGLAQYGIQISRPKGFGHKREMLKAIWQDESINHSTQATYKKITSPIAIIGAGIAGLSCVWALAQRGYTVDIYEQSHPLAGGSGNPMALLNPKLCEIEQSSEHLMLNSWQYAIRHYAQFSAFRPLTVQQIQLKDEQELHYIDDYPNVSPALLSDENLYPQINQHYPQLNLHQAGAVEPHALAEHILKHRNIRLHLKKVESIQSVDDGVQLTIEQQTQFYPAVIVCSAKQSATLLQPFPPLKAIRGQVSWCEHSAISTHHAYSYGGYFAQVNENKLILGASFYPNREDTDVLADDHQHNFNLIHDVFPEFAQTLPTMETWQGRASIRAQTADYFPIVGQVKPHIYSLTGLGSKGFLFAPLCAEIVMAELLGECYPIPKPLYDKLKVKRFKCMRHS